MIRTRAAGCARRTSRAKVSAATPPPMHHDGSIIRGGAAALALALEIRRARPASRVLIIEPNSYPAPEITHTVGESTVEVSAHYLRDRLGLGEHLQTAQLRKMGLRMFFSNDENTDIARR